MKGIKSSNMLIAFIKPCFVYSGFNVFETGYVLNLFSALLIKKLKFLLIYSKFKIFDINPTNQN